MASQLDILLHSWVSDYALDTRLCNGPGWPSVQNIYMLMTSSDTFMLTDSTIQNMRDGTQPI